jgi:hypothetical protein
MLRTTYRGGPVREPVARHDDEQEPKYVECSYCRLEIPDLDEINPFCSPECRYASEADEDADQRIDEEGTP